MAENSQEDDFDIDIYGDGDGGHDYQQDRTEADIKPEEVSETPIEATEAASTTAIDGPPDVPPLIPAENPRNGDEGNDVAQKIASTDQSGSDPVHLPKQAPQTQGLKRKDGDDDRFVDPGATTALFVSELHWWVNDDDVRGWANQSQCEDELLDITFSEHKVNGKSKGQSYVLFKSPQAATAAKRKIESFGEGQQYTKKFTVSYTNPYTNPFKTLPKDGPMRNNAPANNNRSTPGAYGGTGITPQNTGYNNAGSYRGNRGGGYNNRGGMNNTGGYNRGGFQQPMTGGFQGGMSGFQGAPMGGMQPYGGFQNRGGMTGSMRAGPMGMRGGRGGMNGMMGMPMNGMAMGAMSGMGMSMPQMNAGMGMQGMRGFYNHPSLNAHGRHGSPAFGPVWPTHPATPAGWVPAPAAQAGSSTFPASQARPYPPSESGPACFSFPHDRGGAPRSSSDPSSTWASYTRYSPSAASPSLIHFSPPATAAPSQPSTALNRISSSTGTQPHFNPAFFPQQQPGQQSPTGDSNWNPHGAKRTRQE